MKQIGFKSKSVIRDKGHCIMIKVRVNSPNTRAPKYMHLTSDLPNMKQTFTDEGTQK